MKNKIGIATLALFSLLSLGVSAQDQEVGEMMFTAGTVMTDASSNEWAWLQWMATDSELLRNRQMDIYRKNGDADSSSLFSFQGRVQQVTDPRSIELFLSRGEMLGEDLTGLEMAVDSLYAGAEPVGSLSLAEKLSAVISGSQDDPDLYQNLVFMGRAHPAVSMAIGHGFAGKIPTSGTSTFEVRDHSTDEVIGRVTVVAGSPEVLPAPGPISRIPEFSPKGNLNIRLRWDVPDELKRVSLMQFGYNLYRVEKYSAKKWWSSLPPTTAQLLDRVENHESAKKVNRMPILVDAATATPKTWFAVDDNDGLSEGGTPFVDGAEYYYYVTALDLLGRDGNLSGGFLTYPCDRMAPSVPSGVKTRTISDYVDGERLQWVEVSWAHNTNDLDAARYYVYRHTGMADMQSNAIYAVSNRISGAIVPEETDTRLSYEDRSLSSNDWNITYWYTVRAEDNARCTNNLSGNSGPAYGLVRDWVGPGPTTGAVMKIQVQSFTCSFEKHTDPTIPGSNNVELACTRPDKDDSIQWTEFSSRSKTNLLARLYFEDGSDYVAKGFFFSQEQDGSELQIFCRVGSDSGKVSEWAYASDKIPDVDPPSADIGLQFKGESFFLSVSTPGPHHYGDDDEIDTPEGVVPTDEEGQGAVRIYRRVDGGNRKFLEQVVVTNEIDEIVVKDSSGGLVNGGRICYYFQKFDEHGNAGPMEFWDCFDFNPRVEMPVPLLETINSTGEATHKPGLKLNWFCTTPGVERFEIAVGILDGDPLPIFGKQEYVAEESNVTEMDFVTGGVTNRGQVKFYRTGRIGTTFGLEGYPLFEMENLIDLDRKYYFKIRAIGTVGTLGEWSNAEEFRWTTVPLEGPNVPWPARALPDVQNNTFHPKLSPILLDPSMSGYLADPAVGIQVGELPVVRYREDTQLRKVVVLEEYIPMDYLYTNRANSVETIMPCVLYRQQLANTLYESVSGDVVQVSPLMEQIAYGVKEIEKEYETTVYDPFIEFREGETKALEMFLIDTQPVIRGAKYQYMIMRFDPETKELDKIIPAGTITIP